MRLDARPDWSNDPLSWLPEDWEASLSALGEPAYRGRQGFQWLWQNGVPDYDAITVWPKDLRRRMAERHPFTRLRIEREQRSQDGTRKLLLSLFDGQRVEAVVLPHPYGVSVCVSSQVGCNIGCKFCASGLLRRTRDLSGGEIMDQVRVARDLVQAEGRTVTRVDLMGIGEPLDNYPAVMQFLRLVHAPLGMNLSYRHITLSTSGLVPAIRRLADEGLPITLAISLHAPNDALRSQLMPINRAYPLAELLAAARAFQIRTGRRVTFEYAMLNDVNDRPEHAQELAEVLRGLLAHVNLIPWNPVPEEPFQPSPMARVRMFRDIVQQHAISCTIRKELGQEIDAACGQLRRREEATNRPEGGRSNPPRLGADGEPG